MSDRLLIGLLTLCSIESPCYDGNGLSNKGPHAGLDFDVVRIELMSKLDHCSVIRFNRNLIPWLGAVANTRRRRRRNHEACCSSLFEYARSSFLDREVIHHPRNDEERLVEGDTGSYRLLLDRFQNH